MNAIAAAVAWAGRFALPLGLVGLVALSGFLVAFGGDFGPFFSAYISTALVTFGVFELVRRMRRQIPIWTALMVLGAGLVVGIFVNLTTALGPGLYAGFMVGQVFTVGLVLWLRHVTTKSAPAAVPAARNTPPARAGEKRPQRTKRK